MYTQRDIDSIKNIINACKRVLDKTNGMSYEDFINNQDVMDICAVQCQIIGNSVGSISNSLKNDYPEINWRGMYGARCIISHGYGFSSYDLKQLWEIIASEIEKTLKACERISENIQ